MDTTSMTAEEAIAHAVAHHGLLILKGRQFDLFDEVGGAVVCRTCAERPTDIDHWRKLSDMEAAEWRAFIAEQYGDGTNPCERCREPMAVAR